MALVSTDGYMTTSQKKKILIKIQTLEKDLDTLRRVRMEVAASGYASATLSSGGGSKSYTRSSLSELTKAISEISSELNQYKTMLLNGGNTGCPYKTILHVYA